MRMCAVLHSLPLLAGCAGAAGEPGSVSFVWVLQSLIGPPHGPRSSQKDALVAAQVNLIADGGLAFTVHPAPAPDDINWPALWLGWRPRVLRTVAVVLPVAAIMLFPIGIFTGARRRRSAGESIGQTSTGVTQAF